MTIINKEFSPEQNKDIVNYICAATSELPTTGIAYGSSAIVADGKIYFFFDDNSWKAMGAQE